MLVIFDCDGTLVDSQANIIRAMCNSFARMKLAEPDHHAIRRVVGLSLVEAMQALLPEVDAALHQQLAEDYKLAFQRLRAQGGLHQEPLYPGIADLVRDLHGAGVLLGVATGKSDRGLALCLQHHGLADYFMTLQTADRHPSKPHPSMIEQCLADAGRAADDSWMVGDTVYDMHMAGNAQVRAIGVEWGYHEGEELRQAGATHVVPDVAHLHALLEAGA